MSATQQTTTLPTDSELEPVKLFLQNAFVSKQRGQTQAYSVIIQQFKVKDDPEMLWKVILALNGFVSGLLSRPDIFQDILAQIFSFNWKTEMQINLGILNLLGNIVTTNAIYLSSTFKLLVRTFIPDATVSSKEPDPFRTELLKSIHQTIQKTLQQVPTGIPELVKILDELYPHKRFGLAIQSEYIQQLLEICDYLPLVQGRVLDMILQRCLEMDVEIVIEDDGEVRLQKDFETQKLDEHGLPQPPSLEDDELDPFGFSSPGGLMATSFPGQSYASNAEKISYNFSHNQIPAEVIELADKLDAMLSLVIQHFQRLLDKHPPAPTTIPGPSSSSSREAQRRAEHPELLKFYGQLLELFQRRLLLAHKSKYVQFLFFFVAAQRPVFAELFARKLFEVILTVSESAYVRQSAVMYLASYLSRATFLPAALISELIGDLLRWATAYVCHFRANTISIRTATTSFDEFDLQAHGHGLGLGHFSSSSQQLQRAFSSSLLADLHHQAGHSEALLRPLEEIVAQIKTRFESELMLDLVFPASSASALGLSSPLKAARGGADSFIDRVEYDEYGRLQVVNHKVTNHELFYAVVQSVCYILCFHGLDLARDQRRDIFLQHCWNLVFTSRFEPMRYVIKSVRSEFLKLAFAVELFDVICWESFPRELLLLESEFSLQPLLLYQRVADNLPGQSQQKGRYFLLHPAGSSSGAHHPSQLGPNTLESFFPYDPCLLMKICTAIEKSYRSWNGVPGIDDQALVQALLGRQQRTSSQRLPELDFQREIFGEDLDEDDEEEDDDEDDDDKEDEQGPVGLELENHSPNRAGRSELRIPGTGRKAKATSVTMAMSVSYTETRYSTSVTSSVHSDEASLQQRHGEHLQGEEDYDGYGSSYSMSVSSSIPRDQLLLELIQKSRK